jgi:hypothetical protein
MKAYRNISFRTNNIVLFLLLISNGLWGQELIAYSEFDEILIKSQSDCSIHKSNRILQRGSIRIFNDGEIWINNFISKGNFRMELKEFNPGNNPLRVSKNFFSASYIEFSGQLVPYPSNEFDREILAIFFGIKSDNKNSKNVRCKDNQYFKFVFDSKKNVCTLNFTDFNNKIIETVEFKLNAKYIFKEVFN